MFLKMQKRSLAFLLALMLLLSTFVSVAVVPASAAEVDEADVAADVETADVAAEAEIVESAADLEVAAEAAAADIATTADSYGLLSNKVSVDYSADTYGITTDNTEDTFAITCKSVVVNKAVQATTATVIITNNSGKDISYDYNVTSFVKTNAQAENADVYIVSGGNDTAVSGTGTRIIANGASEEWKLYVKGLYYYDTENIENSIITVEDTRASLSFSALRELNYTDGTAAVANDSHASITANGTAVTGASANVAYNAADGLSLSATPDAGYGFFAWLIDGEMVSSDPDYSVRLESPSVSVSAIIYANKGSVGYYGVTIPDFDGEAVFDTLTDALAFQSGVNGRVITVLNDVDYNENCVIPNGTTLLIPFDDAHTLYTDSPEIVTGNKNHVTPTAYRIMTMKTGSSLTVNNGAAISVSGKLSAGGQGKSSWNGSPTGPDGRICMEGSSNITLKNGSNLYAWGYIYRAGANNEGTVTAENGATVYEPFQIRNWRGGSVSVGLALISQEDLDNGIKPAFPFNQYYVQNVEVPLRINKGATEICYSALYAGSMTVPTAIEFIGDNAGMFRLSDGYLIKDYIEDEDRLDVQIYGDSSLSAIQLSVLGIPVDSSSFDLPITNNISIEVKSGETVINQNVSLLPGVELTIDQGSTVTVAEGTEVYVYDSENWNGNEYAYSGCDYITVGYSAANNTSGPRDTAGYTLSDASVDINGTVVVNGGFYASDTADVSSSEKTGQVQYSTSADSQVELYESSANSSTGEPVLFGPVQLRVGDEYISTGGEDTFYNNDYQYNSDPQAEEPMTVYTKYLVQWFEHNKDEVFHSAYYRAGETPSIENVPDASIDNDYVYTTFLGWSETNPIDHGVLTVLTAEDVDIEAGEAFPVITDDSVDYFPVYDREDKLYSVVWLDENGNTVYSEQPTKTANINSANIPAALTPNTYEHFGIEDTADLPKSYPEDSVGYRFADYRGKAAKYVCHFTGWTSNLEYNYLTNTGVCTFTPEFADVDVYYLVLYLNEYQNAVLSAQYFLYDAVINPCTEYAGEEPTKASDAYGYTFSGWKDLSEPANEYTPDEAASRRIVTPTNIETANWMTFVPTFTAEELPAMPTVARHSLSLDGKIGVNFYVDTPLPSGCTADNLTMSFEWGNKFISGNNYSTTEKYRYPESGGVKGTLTDDGLKFTVYVAPKELNDDITVKLMKNGQPIQFTDQNGYSDYEEVYRGTDYIYAVLGRSSLPGYSEEKFGALYELVDKMLIYCAKAQIIFNYNTDDLATYKYYGNTTLIIDSGEDAVDLDSFCNQVLAPMDHSNYSTLPEYLNYYGSSLNLSTETSFMVIIENQDEYWIDSGAKFKSDNQNIDVVYERLGPASTLDIKNIPVARLFDDIELKVNTKDHPCTITVNVASFIREILSGNYDANLKETVLALFYYQDAAQYFFTFQ